MAKLLTALVTLTSFVGPGQHGSGAVELTMRVVGGHMLVPVQASDGTNLELILSTGTLGTSLSESTAARLGDETKLSLGGIPIGMVNRNAIPDASLTFDGVVADGMLGTDTIADYDVLIDAPAGRFHLRPVGRSAPWPGVTLGDPVPIRIYHGVIIGLDAELNGKPYSAMLDLGMSAMVVNTPAASQLGLEVEDTASVAVGSLTVADVPVKLRELAMFQQWDPDQRGFFVVGAPLAFDCAIAISWARAELRTCAR